MRASRFVLVVVAMVVATMVRPAASDSCKEEERDARGNCPAKKATPTPPPPRPTPPPVRPTQIDIRAYSPGDTELGGAQVSLDGKPAGRAPVVLITTPGRHLVEVHKDDLVPYQQWVELRQGERKAVSARLQPKVAKPAPTPPPPAPSAEVKPSKYPIALPAPVDGDAAVAKEVAAVQSFDMSVAGHFKVLDPRSFLANLSAEGLGIEVQKWKDVGAFGVVKFRVTANDIEFRLYEISKGDRPSLTRTYSRKDPTRVITHRWCNEVVKYYTGEPGFFGSKIAFSDTNSGSSRIISMDFDGVVPYVIPNSSGGVSPAWSPSGSIAYTSTSGDNLDLYVAPSGGGQPKQLVKDTGMYAGASYSPDGSKIALTLSKDGNPEIYVISASDGSIIRRLTDHKAADSTPAWSPDGSQIAFVSDRNGGSQIFVVPTNGGAATQVSFNGNRNTNPSWSPRKGKSILAYTTHDGDNYDIVTLDLQTKQMTRITQQMGNNGFPAFSSNGRAVAFARVGQGIYIANADGTGTPVKVWSGSAIDVAWGPAPPP